MANIYTLETTVQGVIDDANHGSLSGGTLHAAVTGSSNGFMSSTDKTKLDGIATSATNTPLTSSAPANVTKATAVVGVATDAARSDHKHDISTAAPSTIGTANSEGTATSLARSDHVHAHGSQTDGTLHAVATASVNGFMSSTDKAKLDGIAPGTGGYIQSKFIEISANTTTTSTTFVTLLTTTFTIGSGSNVILQFAASVSNSNSNNITYFRIQVNATTYRGAATTAQGPSNPGGASIQQRVTGLGAGTHTITVQWRVSGGTGQVRPVAVPDAESASLIIEEVSV